MQFWIRGEGQHKTSFRVRGGQYEFRVGAFGQHGMSSALKRSVRHSFCRPALDSPGRVSTERGYGEFLQHGSRLPGPGSAPGPAPLASVAGENALTASHLWVMLRSHSRSPVGILARP